MLQAQRCSVYQTHIHQTSVFGRNLTRFYSRRERVRREEGGEREWEGRDAHMCAYACSREDRGVGGGSEDSLSVPLSRGS